MPMWHSWGKNKDLPFRKVFRGWMMGFEPTTFGTTIRRSNQLSYNHHIRDNATSVKKRSGPLPF